MSYFKVIKFDAIDSTNNYLKKLYLKKSIQDKLLIVANYQFNGKGQKNNKWHSEPSKNLIFSFYKILENRKIQNPFILNCIISLSVLKVLKQFGVPNLKVKWPNDILSDSKKICGILVENFYRQNFLYSSIIGVGININQTNFGSLENVSSVLLSTGKFNNIDNFFLPLKASLENDIEKKTYLPLKMILDDYELKLYKKNVDSRFKIGDVVVRGSIVGISNTGKLIVTTNEFGLKKYDFKEISLIN